MKLKGTEIAEEVRNVFKEGDFTEGDICSVREIERLENRRFNWRIEFFKNGKKERNYFPELFTDEILDVYNLLLNKDTSNFGFIYFSKIPKEVI